MVDPLFECELALELGMPIGEMRERMSLHELCLVWPAYFAIRNRHEAEAQREAERDAKRKGGL
jgi:hypothetical protein